MQHTQLHDRIGHPGTRPLHALAMACMTALAGLMICAPALAADAPTGSDLSASPATRPAPVDPARNGGPLPGGRMGRQDAEPGPLRERLRDRLSTRQGQEMDEQTWNQVVQFLEMNAPNRFKYFQTMPETYLKQRIRMALLNRYNMVQLMEDQPQDQVLYNLIIHRIQIDDKCWAMAQQYRATTDANVKATLKKKITDLLTEWASNQLEERRIRIDRLKQILAEESARLDKDQANIDQFVTQNVDRVINDENFLLMAAPPRGGDGPLGPPPDQMNPPGMDGRPPGRPEGRRPEEGMGQRQLRQEQPTDPARDASGVNASPATPPGNP